MDKETFDDLLNDYMKVIREFANKMLEVLEKIVSLFPGNEFNGTDESLKTRKNWLRYGQSKNDVYQKQRINGRHSVAKRNRPYQFRHYSRG